MVAEIMTGHKRTHSMPVAKREDVLEDFVHPAFFKDRAVNRVVDHNGAEKRHVAHCNEQ